MKKAFLLLCLTLLSVIFANAQTSTAPSGTGTSADPYLIATLDNLYWVTQNTSSWATGKYFKQTADIDASTTSTWASGAGFTPIGNSTTAFSGNYDGQGFGIYGLVINRLGDDNVGFFGKVFGNPTIQNIKLVDITVKGKGNVGGLIGSQWDGSANTKTYVTNCSTTGSVVAAGSSVGGMFGCMGNIAAMDINRCFSTCTVSTTSSADKEHYGGLAGYVKGYNSSQQVKFTNCYATGDVRANGAAGGFIGTVNKNNGTGSWSTTNCYSTGLVALYGSSKGNFGGFIGKADDTAGTATNCFWNTETSGQSTSKAGTGKTTTQMQTQTTYTNWDFVGEDLNGTNNYWGIAAGTNAGYPVLTWQSPITIAATDITTTSFTANWESIPTSWVTDYKLDVATDAGFSSVLAGYSDLSVSGNSKAISGLTAGTAYYYRIKYTHNGQTVVTYSNKTRVYTYLEVSDATGLAAISNDLAGNYKLTSDITLSSNWTPLGQFTGTLDGNGHIISGLTIDASSTAEQGLFSKTGTGAVIKKLGIEDANVVGNERVGAFVGIMEGGTIEECYVSNSYIEGRDHVGSIAGRIANQAIVQNCYSTAEITSREHQAGGLVGLMNHTGTKILNSYFSGIVICKVDSRPAGIVASRDNDSPTVEKCVNLAPFILGSGNLRVVGNDNITMKDLYSISSCKLSSDVTNYNGGTVPTSDGNYGATKRHGANITGGDENAKTSEFYTSIGWDFTEGTGVWKMLGAGYPVLQWQSAPVNSSALRLASSYSLQNGDQINLNDLVSNRGLVLSFSTTSDKITIAGNIATAHDINTPEDAIISISVNSDFTETDQLIIHLFPTGPITISTPAELNAVTQFPNMDFLLTADLDMTGIPFSGLCSSASPFTGTFDGNGHVIKGLSYNNTATSTLALINATNGATIKNLGIEQANIIGKNDIAAIVGTMSGGTMEACYVGNSYIEGNDHVASLAGKIYGGAVIHDCYSNATIFSRSTQAGGLGGVILDANSKVSKCYFSGKVAIPTSNTRPGGIVALIDNNNGITIEYCVNLASSIIGGSNCRIIQNGSQSTYTLTSNYSISTTIMNPNGSVMSPTDSNVATNKLHGANLPSDADALSSTFYSTTQGWDFTNTWAMLPTGGYPVLQWQTAPLDVTVFSAENKASNAASVNLDELIVSNTAKNAFTYSTTNANVTIVGNTLTFAGAASVETATITIAAKSNFSLTSESVTSFVVTYVPDAVDPIEISTVTDLLIVNSLPSRNFKLMADLDLTGVAFDGLCSLDDPFTGTFDGNGHVISNFTIPSKSYKGVGLFNATRGATVKKLGVEGATVTGTNQDVGIIIGRMEAGVLEECYVLNSQANGYDHVGSLVGGANENGSDGVSIRNCYANSNVHSTNYQAGGLIGTVRKGVVEKCYFAGEVKCDKDRSVGLAGYHDNSGATSTDDIIIRNNINLATLIETKDYDLTALYRIFDNNGNRLCTLDNNYSISTTTLSKTSDNTTATASTELTVGGRNGANLADDADAMKRMFYINTLSWDFDDVWTINEGAEYPQLMVFKPIATIVSNADALIGDVTTGNGSGEYSQANKDAFVAARDAASDDDDREALNAAQSDFLASVNQTFTGTGTWSATDNWSAGFLPANTANVFVSNGELTIDDNVTAAKLTINPDAKLTLNSGKTLSLDNLEIKSDATGTGTFIDNGTTTVTQPATVNQYLTYRSWYLSSPVSGAYALGGTDLIKYYDEVNDAWVASNTLTAGKGYLVNPTNDVDESVVFAGTLNTGNQSIALTRTNEAEKIGFNLIGNPYPSYLDWTDVYSANSSALSTSTMWYRTKAADAYAFWTVNGESGVVTPETASKYIPPMQAFWVRASATGNLQMTNAMRNHAPASNKLLKVKSKNTSERVLLRLKTSNGVYTDEAVVYFDENAADGFDTYDSPKMSNDNVLIPEIFTRVSTNDLAINGMSQIVADREISIVVDGGAELRSTLNITGLENVPVAYSAVLKDKLLNTQVILDADNSTYSFDVVSDETDRFSLIFKAKGTVTALENANNNLMSVYAIGASKIVVSNVSMGVDISVYNLLGEKVYSQKANESTCTLDRTFVDGVYFVRIAGSLGYKVIVR